MIKFYRAQQQKGNAVTLFYNQKPWSLAQMQRSINDGVMNGNSPAPFDLLRGGEYLPRLHALLSHG
jgi:hypothetical protein